MSPPRRPQHDFRQLPVHQRRELEEQEKADELERKLKFYEEIGPIRRHGVWDTKCPKCATEVRPQKTYCQGRPPEAGLEAKCYIVGDHLHCNCPACNYAWIERCNDDELDNPVRGGLRHDEIVDDEGRVHPAPSLSVHERWGVPATNDPTKEA